MENSKISEGWVFKTPQKYISSQEDVRLFTLSDTFRYLVSFIQALSFSVRGFSTDSVQLKTAASSIQSITSLLSKVDSLINDVDPVTGNMRFGNSAFQSWVDRLRQVAALIQRVLYAAAAYYSAYLFRRRLALSLHYYRQRLYLPATHAIQFNSKSPPGTIVGAELFFLKP